VSRRTSITITAIDLKLREVGVGQLQPDSVACFEQMCRGSKPKLALVRLIVASADTSGCIRGYDALDTITNVQAAATGVHVDKLCDPVGLDDIAGGN